MWDGRRKLCPGWVHKNPPRCQEDDLGPTHKSASGEHNKNSRAKKGRKTTAHIPQFYKLFPTAKIKKPRANLAKHVNKFYVTAQTHVLSSISHIFRNLLLQNLLVLVGLLFSFLAPSTHKHPGDLKKPQAFRLACTERTKRVSPCV